MKDLENKTLKDLYFQAESMVEEYQDLLELMKELSAESIAELIEKHTEKAYVNGVIYDFEEKSKEEAIELASVYTNRIADECNYIVEQVEMLEGDVEKVKSSLSAIPFYSNK